MTNMQQDREPTPDELADYHRSVAALIHRAQAQATPIDLAPTNQAKADATLDAAYAAWLADTDDDNPDPDAALNTIAPALIAIAHQLAALTEHLAALTEATRR